MIDGGERPEHVELFGGKGVAYVLRAKVESMFQELDILLQYRVESAQLPHGTTWLAGS